jgi:biopolymer transport protein ExbB
VVEILRNGGPILYLIIITSVVGFGFIIERLIAFWRASTTIEPFFNELEQPLRLGKFDEARALCRAERGLLPALLLTAIEHRGEDPEALKQLLADEVQVTALPQLERNISVISVIARVAPMLGLLGTVWGMISMFETIASNPQFDVQDISRGIFIALGTTAAGLAVAIPLIFAHAYFTTRIKHFEIDCYKYLTRMLRLLGRTTEVRGG